MVGSMHKKVEAAHLACAACLQFRDNDPDLYYCALQCREFPGLCEQFTPKNPVHRSDLFQREVPPQ